MSDACSDNPGLALCKKLIGYGLDKDRPVPGWDIVDGEKPKKTPARKHKKGEWTMQNALRHFKLQARPFTLGRSTVGILLSHMMVLDFDTNELYDKLVVKFPEMEQTVRERTRQGMHIFFMRTPLVEELSLLDGAGQFFGEEDGVALTKLDLKTITSTTTSGFIVVAPSPGKKWITSLLDEKPQPLPDRLARWLAAARGGANPKAGSSKRRAQAGGGPTKKMPKTKGVAAEEGGVVRLAATGGRLFVVPQVDLDASDARLQLNGLAIDSASDVHFYADDLRSTYYFRDTSTRCPICDDLHTNQYIVTYTKEGARYISNFSKECRGATKKKSQLLPFSAESLVEIMRRFEKQCEVLSAGKMAAFGAWARAYCQPGLERHFGAGFEMNLHIFFRATDSVGSPHTHYLVLRKPRDVQSGYTLTMMTEPWHGFRSRSEGGPHVRVSIASPSGLALAAIMYGGK
jgi:hypothetical protein